MIGAILYLLTWIWPSWIQPSQFLDLKLTQLAMIGFHYLHKKTSLIHSDSTLMMAAILKSAILDSAILYKKKLHSFILTQLDDGSHLEFCHPWIQPFCTKKTSLIHSDSTWWWQPSWILPAILGFSHFAQTDSKNFTHSFWLNLMMAAILNLPSWIWPSWIQPSCFSSPTYSHLPRLVSTICTKKLHSFILTQIDDGSHLVLLMHVRFRHSISQKLSDSNVTLFKLILTQTHSFSLNLMMEAIFVFCHLEFCHLGFSQFAQKKTFILMMAFWNCQPDDGSHFVFCHVLKNFTHSFCLSHLEICHPWIQQICKKKLHSFILTQLMMAAILKLMMAAILNSANLDSAILHKKNFTHSFWLNLMMAAILKSAILDSVVLY